MTNQRLRRWVFRSGALLAVVPALTTFGAINPDKPERGFSDMHLEVPAPSTTAVEAQLLPVTTTTTAAPTPTTVAVPPTTRVTAAPVTTTPRVVAASATLEERGQAALALINFPWQDLHYRVDFAGGRVGVLGETNSTRHVITIYIRDGQTSLQLARTIAHEMGHALDFSFTTKSEAQQYLNIRNLPFSVDDWYPTCDGCTDFGSPAGDFAETFAYYLFGPGDFRSLIGPEPTADQLAQLTGIFSPR